MKDFTFFWKTGHRDVLRGETARDAFKDAGYGMAALGAVEVWDNGDSNRYRWDKESKSWIENAEAPA